jgi:hypothetical protein
MKGVLADINVQGHLDILLRVWQSETWREVWNSLAVAALKFADLGLNPKITDAVLWQECQDRQLVLITANRNQDGPDSLETTIRSRNSPASLPVFTVSDARRLKLEATYATRVAVTLLEYFLDIESVRGTGRLYVP